MGIINRLQAYGNWLTTDPIGFIIYFAYLAVAILLTLMLHEIAHGYVALRHGDPTAKMLGRLTLDPRKHLDPVGTIAMVLVGFGWAKPVPINPRNFRGNRVKADFLVSVAGIVTNLTLFILATFLSAVVNPLLWQPEILTIYGSKTFLEISGAGFNALLSGQGGDLLALMRTPWLRHVQRFLLMFATFNLTIGIFNLIPIPPLDGFHILNDLAFKGRLRMTPQFMRGAQIVFLLLLIKGAIGSVLITVTSTVQGGVLNLFLVILGA